MSARLTDRRTRPEAEPDRYAHAAGPGRLAGPCAVFFHHGDDVPASARSHDRPHRPRPATGAPTAARRARPDRTHRSRPATGFGPRRPDGAIH